MWDVPFVVAQKFCEAEGLRLCTADELAAGVAHQGGCRGDPHMPVVILQRTFLN